MKSVLVINVEKIINESATLAEAVKTVKDRYTLDKVGAVCLVNHVKRSMGESA